jgi:predicted HTH domain antitoxin
MEITLHIPEAVAALLPHGESLPREMLEAYAADAYRNERLSLCEVSQLLGLSRWEAEEFLARRQATRSYGFEDRELERASQGRG